MLLDLKKKKKKKKKIFFLFAKRRHFQPKMIGLCICGLVILSRSSYWGEGYHSYQKRFLKIRNKKPSKQISHVNEYKICYPPQTKKKTKKKKKKKKKEKNKQTIIFHKHVWSCFMTSTIVSHLMPNPVYLWFVSTL